MADIDNAKDGQQWRPMTEHVFPWPEKALLVAAFPRDGEPLVDVYRVSVGEHGALFDTPPNFLSLHERGWVPFAWRIDDTPERDDDKWPPLWADYLTRETDDEC